MLVALLAAAAISSFAMAYYLFSSRWEAQELVQQPVTNQFQGELSNSFGLRYDSSETFLSYLPHSGFHNQRIAFENALVLSRMMNRTLLVPPVYLGNKPVHYDPFDILLQELVLANNVGLHHCSHIPSLYPLPLDCNGYFDQTQIPWDWLVDIDRIKQHQVLSQRWNFTEGWLYENLNVSKSDILFIKDNVPYQYRFLDTRNDVSPANHKFLDSIYIQDLALSRKRLIHIGTLFGSSRLRLKNPYNVAIRGDIRDSMVFTNPLLLVIARSISSLLGPLYIGVHLRLGDGYFKENAEIHAWRAWKEIVHDVLGYTEEETLQLELAMPSRDISSASDGLRARVSGSLSCQGQLHTDPHDLQLNTPIYVSTDVDRKNSALITFWRTFPCIFFISDFANATSLLDELHNPRDGVKMKQSFLPFVDALVIGQARKVVGTKNSTFSTFVQDVLWRKHHNLLIAQRG
ncbi:hypothetical protein H0H92_002308 [Tricholoma furcatifolium]|nr:hypothetical protein H0H92_002308 [Tricholoma furcatifolium]